LLAPHGGASIKSPEGEGKVLAEPGDNLLKSIDITFTTGRDVLKAYWGFLSNGGLVLQEEHDLELGDPVALKVTIASSQREYRLRGHVVRRPDVSHTSPERTVIEFAPGEPHDLLLSAAWAETDNVPARRHRRQPVDREIAVRVPNGGANPISGRLLNVSLGGCCVNVTGGAHRVRAGESIELVAGQTSAHGLVRWQRADDLGVQFDESPSVRTDVERFVRMFL
jgi:Tfp pilus assembly protein PilZ